MLAILLLTALTAAAFVGTLAPPAVAAPSPPWFGPSIKVNQVPAYNGQQPSLAVGSDGVAYVAFVGWGGTTTQNDIFFSKSLDGGRTWSPSFKVNTDAGAVSQSDPSVALDHNNNISIVWTDPRGGTDDIYFSRSTDGGDTFSPNVLVSLTTASFQIGADVAIDPQDTNLVHVVWTDNQNAGSTGVDIYYANSTDGGTSFNTGLRVNNDAGTAEQSQPAIAVASDSSLYVVWGDGRTAGQGRDIFFSRSTNRGATWTPNVPVDDDSTSAQQSDPSLAVDEAGTIYVAWSDYRTPNTAPDVYATRSTNAGASFAANVPVNDDGGATPQATPTLAVDAGKVCVAWIDFRTGGSTSYDIYSASSEDGIAWSANRKVNDEAVPTAFQFQPSIAVDGAGNVFAAWFDNRATGADIYAATLDVVAPTANAGPALSGDQGASIAFSGSASTDNFGIATYAWDFGDGSSATAEMASHAYARPGVYTARLTVWDGSGNSATATTSVTVRDTERPAANGGGDRSVVENEPLFFDASASTDNVGVTEYNWTFGDGTSANTKTASHTYARPGVYDITLTVTDAAGNSAMVSFKVTVGPDPLMGLVQILAGVVGALAIGLIVLASMLLRLRKRPATSPAAGGSPMPPPPREADPLDMTFPPASPPEER